MGFSSQIGAVKHQDGFSSQQSHVDKFLECTPITLKKHDSIDREYFANLLDRFIEMIWRTDDLI